MLKDTYKNKKALVLLSGGQDSTTCLYWALSLFNEVEAIGFDYGQMHAKELLQAHKIAQDAGVAYRVLDVKGLLADSSLTKHEDHNAQSGINSDLPASFTAGRNILFLSVAASYAAGKGINDIVTGVCQTDYSGYPDCRRTTIDAMQNTISLGYGAGDFRIHTPLMYITKAETWKLANDMGCLDVIINDTLTDYNGDTTRNEWGMGRTDNPASELRAKGYFEAKEKGWI
jgi:7-cyano-7-deazaguanine synthase